MKSYRRFVAMLMVLGLLPVIIEATVVEYDWIVDYMSASSDCVKNLCLSINQQFSSPTIHAVEGDTLVICVTNAISKTLLFKHIHATQGS
jgi:hypothetical protein